MQVIAWQLRLRGQVCLGCSCALSTATTCLCLCPLCMFKLTEVCAGGVGVEGILIGALLSHAFNRQALIDDHVSMGHQKNFQKSTCLVQRAKGRCRISNMKYNYENILT